MGGVSLLSIQSLIWSPHLSCKHDQIKIRDYMDRRVTSATWGPPPPCKQAVNCVGSKNTKLLRVQGQIKALHFEYLSFNKANRIAFTSCVPATQTLSTLVSNVCEPTPTSLFWAANGLNELPEVRFPST